MRLRAARAAGLALFCLVSAQKRIPSRGAPRLQVGRHYGMTYTDLFAREIGFCRWAQRTIKSDPDAQPGSIAHFAAWVRKRFKQNERTTSWSQAAGVEDDESEEGAESNWYLEAGVGTRCGSVRGSASARPAEGGTWINYIEECSGKRPTRCGHKACNAPGADLLVGAHVWVSQVRNIVCVVPLCRACNDDVSLDLARTSNGRYLYPIVLRKGTTIVPALATAEMYENDHGDSKPLRFRKRKALDANDLAKAMQPSRMRIHRMSKMGLAIARASEQRLLDE